MMRLIGPGLLIMGLVRPVARRHPANQTAPSAEASSAPTATPSTASPTASASEPSATPTPVPTTTPTAKPKKKPHPISVQALIEKKYDGRDLKLGRRDRRRRTRTSATWSPTGATGADLRRDERARRQGTVPGAGAQSRLYRPRHLRPRPGHGPGARLPGPAGIRRAAHRLPRARHLDQRQERRLRAAAAVRGGHDQRRQGGEVLEAEVPGRDRVGMAGPVDGRQRDADRPRAAQPGLVDAAVIYASVSSLAADNWKQFSSDAEDQRTNRRIARSYGLPEDNPEFWRAASARPYFDRVTEPIMVHHGLQDDTCPIDWSRRHRAGAAQGRQGRHLPLLPGRGPHLRGAVADDRSSAPPTSSTSSGASPHR